MADFNRGGCIPSWDPKVDGPLVIPRVFRVSHQARPFTVNEAMRMHRMALVRVTKEWRHAFGILASQYRGPVIERATITVELHLKGKRKQDPAGCCIATKAAIDGIVDAGILPGDGPENVVSVTFLAPIFEAAADEMTLVVTEVTDEHH